MEMAFWEHDINSKPEECVNTIITELVEKAAVIV
jgi:hypothetical protein